jgi:hypothetical protein
MQAGFSPLAPTTSPTGKSDTDLAAADVLGEAKALMPPPAAMATRALNTATASEWRNVTARRCPRGSQRRH